ncbi:GLPGLI family protein [Flammeovirga sp. OC4]|uniref:GLPGLI family protein n=1 Tax=Flammeovirga sp. OC4 TaxID=1382345 RepID=UPI000693E0CD|nr:GLPGLI family protein [Flammeovirga sp. OC4]
MKINKLLFLSFLVALSNLLFAQSPIGHAKYLKIINGLSTDTTNYNLYFNQETSLFIRYKEQDPHYGEKSSFYRDNNDKVVTINPMTIDDYVCFNSSSNKSYSKIEIKDKAFIVYDSISTIQWEIQAETKKIGSFNCQKAVGDFRGRSYEAWFTFEVPVNIGPWKLRGLPGLIIEVEDKAKEVRFSLTSIEYPCKDCQLNIPPIDSKETSLQQFLVLKKKYQDAAQARANANAPAGVNITIKFDGDTPLEKEYEFLGQ